MVYDVCTAMRNETISAPHLTNTPPDTMTHNIPGGPAGSQRSVQYTPQHITPPTPKLNHSQAISSTIHTTTSNTEHCYKQAKVIIRSNNITHHSDDGGNNNRRPKNCQRLGRGRGKP